MSVIKMCLGAAILGGSLALAIVGTQVWGQPEAPPVPPLPPVATLPKNEAPPGRILVDPPAPDQLDPIAPKFNPPGKGPNLGSILIDPADPDQPAPAPPPLELPKADVKPISLGVDPVVPEVVPPKPPQLGPLPDRMPEVKILGPSAAPEAPPPSPKKLPALEITPGHSGNKPAKIPAFLPPPSPASETSQNLPIEHPRVGKTDAGVHLEWLAPSSGRLGQPIPCQLLVSNAGPTPVQQVVVRLPMGPGVICAKSEPRAATDGQLLTWSLGTLPSGQSRKLEMHLATQARGPLTCQATVTFSSAVAHTVQIREPLLALKLRLPDKVVAGDNVTLSVTASNPGDGPAEFIKVKVELPEGLEHPRGRTIAVDLGNLKPKETRTVQLICQAKIGGRHQCLASAAAEGNLNAKDAGHIEVLLPRLDLAVTGPKLRYIDRHAVYTFKMTNPGTAPVDQIALSEVLPAGFKFHAASSGGRYDESLRTVSWAIGDLLPGQSKEVQLDVIAVAPGDHRHVASVSSGRGLKTDSEVVTRVEGLSSLLVELADTDDPVEVGADTAYEIRVTNTGTQAETNLEVVCTLPEKMAFKGAKCGAGCGHRVEGRDVIFEPLPRLAPRADIIYRVQVRGLAAGDVRCRVRVRSDGIPDPIIREEGTRIYNDEMPGR